MKTGAPNRKPSCQELGKHILMIATWGPSLAEVKGWRENPNDTLKMSM
jgi:hypothetical protein